MLKLIPLPYWIGSALLLLAAVAGFGYNLGSTSTQRDWDAQKAADSAASMAIKAKQDAVSASVDKRHVQKIEKIRTVYETIVKEVKAYVKTDADYSCVIPDSLVRLHDEAAHAAVSDTPGGANAEAGGANIAAR